jgi:hypothetical protein
VERRLLRAYELALSSFALDGGDVTRGGSVVRFALGDVTEAGSFLGDAASAAICACFPFLRTTTPSAISSSRRESGDLSVSVMRGCVSVVGRTKLSAMDMWTSEEKRAAQSGRAADQASSVQQNAADIKVASGASARTARSRASSPTVGKAQLVRASQAARRAVVGGISGRCVNSMFGGMFRGGC